MSLCSSSPLADGRWLVDTPEVVPVGKPDDVIVCMTIVHQDLWCGSQNMIHVLNMATMEVKVRLDEIKPSEKLKHVSPFLPMSLVDSDRL